MLVLDFVLMLIGMEKIHEHLQVNFVNSHTLLKPAPVSSNVLSQISEMRSLSCSINPLINGNPLMVWQLLQNVLLHDERDEVRYLVMVKFDAHGYTLLKW